MRDQPLSHHFDPQQIEFVTHCFLSLSLSSLIESLPLYSSYSLILSLSLKGRDMKRRRIRTTRLLLHSIVTTHEQKISTSCRTQKAMCSMNTIEKVRRMSVTEFTWIATQVQSVIEVQLRSNPDLIRSLTTKEEIR